MTFLEWISLFNNGLILLFGLLLSVLIAGGYTKRQQKRYVLIMALVLMLIQGVFWKFAGGEEIVRQLYPIIAHLPIVILLVTAFKKSIGQSIVSVCTAYLCCQLPRWGRLLTLALLDNNLAEEISYTISIVLTFWVLKRYFVKVIYQSMTISPKAVLFTGSVPIIYYLFDYITMVYLKVLYRDIPALNEFLPTALVFLYVVFLAVYHNQNQRQMRAEMQQSVLEDELRQSETEIEYLRNMEMQTAIYRHDMRHHMAMIQNYLETEDTDRAVAYIKEILTKVEALSPTRYCKNETINLLCASYAGKAEKQEIALRIKVNIPENIAVSDMELCSILSNGLENAFHAVAGLGESQKWVELYCDIRRNKMMLEIRNPYAGEIVMDQGVPVSRLEGHGYGCRSIKAITEKLKGNYMFEAEQGIFVLRIMLPWQ